jgi:hypothetical protein
MRNMIRWSIVLLFVSAVLSVSWAQTAGKARVSVRLNNNPACQAVLKSSIKKETWPLENVPSLTVSGEGLTDGEQALVALCGGKKIAEEKISVKDGGFKKQVRLAGLLESPQEIEVLIGDELRQTVPVALKRLYGRVTFADNTPVKRPIVADIAGSMIAVGDREGNYEIWLDGSQSNLAVFDTTYSYTSVETWLHEIDLKEDTRVDIRIDKLEVYEFGSWRGNSAVNLHFVPMSLTRGLNVARSGVIGEAEQAAQPDFWPRLTAGQVKVFIDGEEAPVASFSEYQDYMFDLQGRRVTRPGYILAVPRKSWKKGLVKVEVIYPVQSEGGEVTERGQAFLLGNMP